MSPPELYVERLPRPELRRHVACIWTERSPHRDRVVPDGYVDLVFGKSLWVRGPDTRAHGISSPPGSRFVGVRFRPGAAVTVLGVPASELVDDRVFLRELWGPRVDGLEERLRDAPPDETAALLEAAVLDSVLRHPDPAVEAVVSLLDRSSPPRIRELAGRLGLSERQLLRRSRIALGYGPKTLGRIFRFQRFCRLASIRSPLGLAQLALLAGYADQAHLTRECRRLAGETPSAFLRPFSSRRPVYADESALQA